MASKTQFVVAEKKTVWGKGREVFGPGSKVSMEILGCKKSDFDSLVKDGVVVNPGGKSVSAPEPPAGDADGDSDKE